MVATASEPLTVEEGVRLPRFGAVVLDCPDPLLLAEFYATLLGWKVDPDSTPHWATVRVPGAGDGPALSFQYDPDHRPAPWPDPARPRLVHLDLASDDLDVDEQRVLLLGARPLYGPEDAPFRVYADPAGHPFCLCAC